MSGLKLLFTILRIGILAFALDYASSPSDVWNLVDEELKARGLK